MARTRGGRVRRPGDLPNIQPGPDTLDVLHMQRSHRSDAVWAGEGDHILQCRHHHVWRLHDRVRPMVQDAGFYGVCQIGHLSLDWPLITALVERWRQETHSFHLTVGESTITLQDVSILLGLRIDGSPVTNRLPLRQYEWPELCERLLGLRPAEGDISGSSLKLRWLSANFSEFPQQLQGHIHIEAITSFHARAYILYLFGAVLFPDTSGDTVPLMFLPLLEDLQITRLYSWGSATLAHLYRALCRACKIGVKQIGGNLLLLQLWSWERLHIGRPRLRGGPGPHDLDAGLVGGDGDEVGDEIVADDVGVHPEPANRPPLGARWLQRRTYVDNPTGVLRFYRDQLDDQADHQVIWQPYTPALLTTVPPICLESQHLWRSRVPLICFAIVEFYLPDRVMRQFGLVQHIPDRCDTLERLHTFDRRGRGHSDWHSTHLDYVVQWLERADHIVVQRTDDPAAIERYISWYNAITRRRIGPPTQLPPPTTMQFEPSASKTQALVQGMIAVAKRCATALRHNIDDYARAAFTEVINMCTSTMDHVGEHDRLERGLGEIDLPVRGRGGRARGRGRRTSRRGGGRVPVASAPPASDPVDDFTVGPSQLDQLGAASTQRQEDEPGPSHRVYKRRSTRH